MNIDNLSKYLNLITVVLGIFITFKTCSWDDKLKNFDLKSGESKLDKDNISFDREFKFKIYQLTVDAIKSKDNSQQEAALLVVNNLVSDTTFRQGLNELFKKSNTVSTEIKNAATVANFDIKESKQQNPVYSSENKILVDIFYLNSNPNNRVISKKIQDALAFSNSYNVRLRAFSKQQNEKVGYKLTTNQLRFDESEKNKATALSQIINQLLLKDGIKVDLRQTNKGNNTPEYLSLFIVTDSIKEFSDEFSDEFK